MIEKTEATECMWLPREYLALCHSGGRVRNGPRQVCPAESWWDTLTLGPDDRAVPLKVNWKKTMPSFPCRKIFSSAVLYSIKITVYRMCLRAHTHTLWSTMLLHLNPLWWSLSSDTENATKLTQLKSKTH